MPIDSGGSPPCPPLTPRKTILAGIGLHGPWLKHDATYMPLPEDDNVLAIGLRRAAALVDAKRA